MLGILADELKMMEYLFRCALLYVVKDYDSLKLLLNGIIGITMRNYNYMVFGACFLGVLLCLTRRTKLVLE